MPGYKAIEAMLDAIEVPTSPIPTETALPWWWPNSWRMVRALVVSPDVCKCVLCREWVMTSDLVANGAYIEDEYGPDTITACSMCCERSHAERVAYRPRQKCAFCKGLADRNVGDDAFPIPSCEACDTQLNEWKSREFDKQPKYDPCHICGVRDATVFDGMWEDHLPMAGNWCRECEIDFETGVHNAGPSHERWAAYEERKANA